MLGGRPGQGQGLELSQLLNPPIPRGQALAQGLILGLEPVDLGIPRLDSLARLLENLQPPLEFLREVLVGARALGTIVVPLRIEAGAGHPGLGGEGLEIGPPTGGRSPRRSRPMAAWIAASFRALVLPVIQAISFLLRPRPRRSRQRLVGSGPGPPARGRASPSEVSGCSPGTFAYWPRSPPTRAGGTGGGLPADSGGSVQPFTAQTQGAQSHHCPRVEPAATAYVGDVSGALTMLLLRHPRA